MLDNLGRALYLIRDLRGKSQAEVAREAGIGKSQLSKYEGGRELPKLESLGKVLTVLDVGLFEFFYTMHLLDREEEKLGLRRDATEQPLPPPTFSGGGLLSSETDEAFQRVLRDVLALYQLMVREKLLSGGHEGGTDGGTEARGRRGAGHLQGT
jgi:transcriptional regulator with XRE-family HTH domain